MNSATSNISGVVEGIFVSPAAGQLPHRLDCVTAVAGRGLAGDRYLHGAGTYSDHPDRRGRHLTLIEADALEQAGIDGPAARRNVVVRGVALAHLVGKRFRIGDVECLGRRLCEPCAYLEELTKPGVMRTLAHTGLRADILTDGEISVGDPIFELDVQS